MKRLSRTMSAALVMTAALFAFSACTGNNAPTVTDAFKIEGADEASTYTQEGNVITLTEKGTPEYTLSGPFEGQIVVKAKGTVLKLNGVTLTNKDKPAIQADLKVEIKTVENTKNVIKTTGEANKENKIGAINGEKAVEIGGSGELEVSGSVYHGIKADDCEVKGSGKITVSGTDKGSAINCNNFNVKADKTFTLNLKDSKTGIKADKNITILSGTFNLSNLGTGFKTDKFADDGKTHKIEISSNATVNYADSVTKKTDTDPAA